MIQHRSLCYLWSQNIFCSPQVFCLGTEYELFAHTSVFVYRRKGTWGRSASIIGTCRKLGSSNYLHCIYLIWLETFVLFCRWILWCQIIISANRGSEENETSHSYILLIKLFYNLIFIRVYLGLFPVLVDQRCNIAVLENSWLTAFISASPESSCKTVISSWLVLHVSRHLSALYFTQKSKCTFLNFRMF